MRVIVLSSALALFAAPLLAISCSSGSPASPANGDGGGETSGSSSGSGSSGSSGSGSSTTGSGSGAADGGCTAFMAPAPLSSTVSFQKDVYPIFVNSCAFSSCHDGSKPELEFLATKDDAGSSIPKSYAAVVGKLSVEAPSMAFVAAGDAGASFLMHKMDDDLCSILSQCAADNSLSKMLMRPPCGRYMPDTDNGPGPQPDESNLLSMDKRNVVRTWIEQGAQNN